MNNNQLMFFNEHTDIYWHGAFMGIAVLLGSLVFWVFARRIREGAANPIKYIILFGYPLALVLSRLEYCWFRQDEFSGGLPDILDISMGGFGLAGAMLGVALVMLIVGRKNKSFSAIELFDAASPAAALAVCIGRMGSFFSSEERGFELYTDFFRLVMFTEYSAEENKIFLLVYPYEAIIAGLLFLSAIVTFNKVYRSGKLLPGTVTIRFLLGFTLSQILFESWRSDTLFMVTLGFVRFNQALCAVVLAVVLVVVCVKYAKKFGFKGSQIWFWLIMLLGIALAFVCEFFMTGGNHLQNYTGMMAGLLAVYITARSLIAKACTARRLA